MARNKNSLAIWIESYRNDIHALYLKHGLVSLGHDVCVGSFKDLFYDYGGTISIHLSNESKLPRLEWRFDHLCDMVMEKFDVFIIRKNSIITPFFDLELGDVNKIYRFSSFKDVVYSALEIATDMKKVVINDLRNAMRASQKPYQLYIARKLGLKIPETIISNEETRVLQFCCDIHANNIAVKSLVPMTWKTSSGAKFSLTQKSKRTDIEKNKKSIRVCPTIYQEYVEKQYELRITVIGERVLAVKILSNNDQKTMIDWRAAHIYGRSPIVEKFSLPAEWESMAKAWVNEMGLLFGAIDAIVNKNGQIVFLEVNPFGQFLWCEQLVPDVHILDAFCRVVEESCGILRSRDSGTISLQDLEKGVMKELSEVKC